MQEKNHWWQKVETIIEENSLLRHPFYRAWQMGNLSLDDLRYYAEQYYAQVAHFPRYVSGVHSNTPDLKIRQMLLENLMEEERGEENHPELWLRFCEGVGLPRVKVQNAFIRPETVECVRTFLALTKNSNPLVGLSALYAYESQIPAVSATKRQGLKDFYGIAVERSHAFFSVHQKADVWHSQVEKEAIQNLASTEAGRELVKQSVQTACRAVWKLLDGVMQARQICTSC